MKKIFYITTLLISTILASCSNVDPVVWNTNIIGTYNKMLDDIEEIQELISLETIGEEDINKQIEGKGTAAITTLDKAIQHLTTSDIPENAEAYQKATLEMLETGKQQMQTVLKFVNFTEDTTESDIDRYASDYDHASSVTSHKVDAFIEAQKEFAEKIGFNLE